MAVIYIFAEKNTKNSISHDTIFSIALYIDFIITHIGEPTSQNGEDRRRAVIEICRNGKRSDNDTSLTLHTL